MFTCIEYVSFFRECTASFFEISVADTFSWFLFTSLLRMGRLHPQQRCSCYRRRTRAPLILPSPLSLFGILGRGVFVGPTLPGAVKKMWLKIVFFGEGTRVRVFFDCVGHLPSKSAVSGGPSARFGGGRGTSETLI